VDACVRTQGLNWQVDTEGDQAFLYEDGQPVALIIPKYKALTIASPYVGNPRPAFRITRMNVTMEGNFTLAYQASATCATHASASVCLLCHYDVIFTQVQLFKAPLAHRHTPTRRLPSLVALVTGRAR
jgi:hypothetical protein